MHPDLERALEQPDWRDIVRSLAEASYRSGFYESAAISLATQILRLDLPRESKATRHVRLQIVSLQEAANKLLGAKPRF